MYQDILKHIYEGEVQGKSVRVCVKTFCQKGKTVYIRGLQKGKAVYIRGQVIKTSD